MSSSLITSLFRYIIRSAKNRRLWIRLLSTYAIYKLAYIYIFDPLRHIPGPWWSCFTSIPYQIQRACGTIDQYSASIHRKYGTVVRVGPTEVSLGKNEDIKLVFSTYKYPKSKLYERSMAVDENMISTLDENFNRVRRRQVGPAFTQTGLDSVEDLVLEVGIFALKQKLDKEIQENGDYVFNFFSAFQSVTADIIGELSFGQTFDAVKNDGHPILGWVNSFMVISVFCVIFPLTMKLPFLFKSLKHDRQMLIDFTAESIKKRRELIDNNSYKASRIDILQMYITAVNPNGTKLSEDELISETVLMLLAGTDTSSVTMTWLLHFYTLYPDVYKKVVEEVNEAFPDKTKIIRYKEARQKLAYFMATVYECMRLKPAVSGVLPRESSSEGVQLSECYVPRNVEIFLVIEGANHDPSIWESPKKFIPERFLGENGQKLSKDLVTFSSGVRICPGRNLAWMEILTIMPNLVRDYDIKLLPGSVYNPENLDPNRENEPLLFDDYVLGTRIISDYKNVCKAVISHKA